MQKRLLKLIFLSVFGLTIGLQSAVSQDVNNELKKADSLFAQRKYTQSLSIYESIYKENRQATSAMLLKMAYSQEAMGNLSQAIIYLHDYYNMSADEDALDKMQELAQVNGLVGYENDDIQKLVRSIEEFRIPITGVLIALSVLLVSMMLRKQRKHQERSIGLTVGFVLVLGISVYFVNFFNKYDKAIITSGEAYIMTGPSAAATLMEVAGQGHKVEVIDKKDIWYEIKWKGKRGYIRENNLYKL